MNKDDSFQFDPPLFAKTADAERLFGISRVGLYRLRRDHPDFKALTITHGNSVLYDVPEVYKWLQSRKGNELE